MEMVVLKMESGIVTAVNCLLMSVNIMNVQRMDGKVHLKWMTVWIIMNVLN